MERIELKNKTIFVTGAAGFIGSNLVLKLLETVSPVNIVGIDNMNDYYDVSIKNWRLEQIEACASKHPESSWMFLKGDIADWNAIDGIFAKYKPHVVVNLAAQCIMRAAAATDAQSERPPCPVGAATLRSRCATYLK